MLDDNQPNKHVTVIGAGVQGLTVACLLQSRGYQTTVVGHSTPSEPGADKHYTSPKAGANWFSFAEKDDVRLQEWDALTLRTLERLADDKDAGIWQLPCNQYWGNVDDFEEPWYARTVEGYSHILPTSLPPHFKAGVQFNTVTINVPKYLTYLTTTFLSLGGKFSTNTQLAHIKDAFCLSNLPTVLVVNCTGLGARPLGGVEDADVYPTRGQTILVSAPQVKRTVMDVGGGLGGSDVTYVIPRGDGTVILGGTYQPNEWNLVPDPPTAEQIMQRCIVICPELVEEGGRPRVLRHDVGLRPSRKGGVRLEVELFGVEDGKVMPVVHDYGHGGYGYQSSWGCAASVFELVDRQLSDSKEVRRERKSREEFLREFVDGVFEKNKT
ncbi:hypothetical protein HDV00_000259 [Rhizophlyctis rosea]|nr:hypothetical protein HDV00_000259 [Rhizophlyctis rosea]